LKISENLEGLERDPQTIRNEILEIQQAKQRSIDLFVGMLKLVDTLQPISKAIFAAGNLWLEHILVTRIYDTRDEPFETALQNETRAQGLSWIGSQIIGILPIVGITVSFLDCVSKMAKLRSTRWTNADTTLAFLDTYGEALDGWICQCQEHTEHARRFIDQITL